MAVKNNVIDISTRLKSTNKQTKKEESQNQEAAEVVDINWGRQSMLTQERRQNRRSILSELFGVFAIVPEQGLQKVILHDISEGGISFDLENQYGRFRDNDLIAIRIYLNHENYLAFTVKVKHVADVLDEGVRRHGALFVKQGATDEALKAFVSFVEKVSLSLKKDTGDLVRAR